MMVMAEGALRLSRVVIHSERVSRPRMHQQMLKKLAVSIPWILGLLGFCCHQGGGALQIRLLSV